MQFRRFLIATITALALLAAACGGSDSGSTSSDGNDAAGDAETAAEDEPADTAGEDGGDTGGDDGGGESPGVTEDEIILGTTTGLTGPIASACLPIDDGARVWFEHVNAEGGVQGRMINNIVLDDGYDAARALQNARELAEEPVLAYFGGCGSLQPPAVVTVAEEEQIPYLFMAAGLPEIIPSDMVRSVYPLFVDQLRGIVEWAITEGGGPGRMFLVNARQPGHEATIAAAAEGAVAAGGEHVGTVTVNSGEQSDWAPIALQIKEADADYVTMHLTSADASRLVMALEAADAMPENFFIGTSVLLSAAFLDPIGNTLDGRIVTAANFAPATSPDAAECVELLEANDVDVDTSSIQGCTFAQVMTHALEQSEDLSREGLLATLDSWEDEQAAPGLPPLTFGSDQHIGLSTMGVLAVEDGQVVSVEGASFPITIN